MANIICYFLGGAILAVLSSSKVQGVRFMPSF